MPLTFQYEGSDMDKPATKSKKFLAFLIVEIGFFMLMGAMIWSSDMSSLSGNMAFLSLSLSSAFLAVGYILGQAYVDKFVQMASHTFAAKGPSIDGES